MVHNFEVALELFVSQVAFDFLYQLFHKGILEC